jgi:hypothetical protein
MGLKEMETRWRALSEEVIKEMSEWRAQHPKATLKEIESTLDKVLAGLRVQMLQDTILTSKATDWRGEAEGERCPECGVQLKARGKQSRRLQTNGGQELVLKREYGQCPACGTGLFPPG